MYTEKDISDLPTDFYGRAQANGKIQIGMLKTKIMKALLHRVKDFYHISGYPTIVYFNEAMLIHKLDTAMYRA